ncbi:zonular occludens toxin domain-containing protein [Chromobacterium violaceum]|uniref:zonular occludens toxin domain-containing protein n=1 Tax=Chromobacterium violaceum TaxID=536 RepID=UPI00385B5A8C
MIYLVTAVPGSGKSLYTLNWLRKKSDDESRQVYYHNIPLSPLGKETLQWIEIPDPREWMSLPPGAIFVIDECQFTFPVRKSAATTPDYVEKFSTHRHLGIDIVLITQHPNLLDSFIRRLVGTHIHLMRQFGAERSTVLTWQEGCQENPNSKSAQKSCLDRRTFVFPKEVYSWYKSAETHTHKFQMPLRLKQMIIGLILVVCLVTFCIWYLYHNFYAKPKEDAEKANKAVASQPATQTAQPSNMNRVNNGSTDRKGRVKTAESFLTDYQPRVEGRPESAPAYDDLTEPRTFPKVSACMATANKCSCYNQQGNLIEMDDYRCRFYVTRGWFDPYIQPVENREDMREVRADKVVASAPAYRSGPTVLTMTNADLSPKLEGRK